MNTARRKPAGGLSRTVALGVAGRIQSLRLRLDRTRGGFASLVGVSAETVEAWELGRDIVRDDLVLIADTTGASLHWLIAGLTPERVEAIRSEAIRVALAGAPPNRARRPGGVQDFAASGRGPEPRAAHGPRTAAGVGKSL